MTTATALIARCKTRFGDASGDIVSSADWLAYINEAYDEANRHSPFWPFEETADTSVTIAAGANSASLETEQAGSWRVISVLNTTDDYTLAPAAGAPFSDYPTESADPGSPEVYRLFGNTLQVYPYTDHAIVLRIEVFKPPTALLDNSSSAPVWPPEFHSVLIEGALAMAYRDDGNDTFADKHYEKFLAGISKMEEALLSGMRAESYPQIIDTGW
jgi:hypothetical protein